MMRACGAEQGCEDPDLSVVVMAYDEAGAIEAVVRDIIGTMHGSAVSHEILIVDDGSTDGTGDVADQLALAFPHVRVIHHAGNQGLGAVYRTGFESAKGRLLTFFPADGQFPPSIILHFLGVVADRDLILGYLPDRDGATGSKILSRLERLLYWCLFGSLPRFQGVMMVRTDVLRSMTLTSSGRGWGVLMELVIRCTRSGARMISLPTPCRPRLFGRSKVNNLRSMRANLQEAFRLRAHL